MCILDPRWTIEVGDKLIVDDSDLIDQDAIRSLGLILPSKDSI